MAEIVKQNNVTVIMLGPEYESLDDGGLKELQEVLLAQADAAEPPVVVLDMEHTTFIGSAFLEVLFRGWNRLTKRDGTLAFCSLDANCEEVLRVSRLDTLWQLFPTRDEAIQALSGN